MKVLQLELSKIRTDGGTQMRAEIHTDVYLDYRDKWMSGVEFDPVDVFFDGSAYWLADGFHRFYGAREADKSAITARLHSGTIRDAILFACSANVKHGLRRSNDDKRRAVMALLEDDEWKQWSDNRIAEQAGVSQPFVGNIRRQLITVISSTADGQNDGEDHPKPPEKRKGKDGRTRTVPSKQLCDRCRRVGAVKDCPNCAGKKPANPVRSSTTAAAAPKVEPAKPRASKPITDTRCLNLIKTCEAALSEEDADEALKLALDAAKAARELCLDLTHHPTLDEVKAYCEERKNSVNPETWYAHYKSNGWMVGKNRMRDWRAAVVTWEGNEKKWTKERSDGKATGRVSSPQSSIDAWERKAARTRS